MNLTSCFTAQGQQLSVKLLSGSTLVITRVMAGTGQTPNPATATALSAPRQSLSPLSIRRNGNTITLPATLVAAQAASGYRLTELGVYAQDPDLGEILYKVYTLDEPVSIAPSSPLILRFYLEETVQWGQAATVSLAPSGLLLESDLQPLWTQARGIRTASETMHIAAADLQAAIDALPRNLNHCVSYVVSGTVEGNLTLVNFYGNGYLDITGTAATPFTVKGMVFIQNCSILVDVHNVVLPAIAAGDKTESRIYAENSSCARLYNLSVTGNGLCYGLLSVNCRVILSEFAISNCNSAVMTRGITHVVLHNDTDKQPCANNTYGIYVYGGGFVQLSHFVQNTLGAPTNVHSGGFISTNDGAAI